MSCVSCRRKHHKIAGTGGSVGGRAGRPGWVVLDVAMMPGLDGFEMARRLKALPATAHIPIIFMTGLCETEHLAAPQAPGVLLGWLIDAARQLHSGQCTAAAWDWLTVRTC